MVESFSIPELVLAVASPRRHFHTSSSLASFSASRSTIVEPPATIGPAAVRRRRLLAVAVSLPSQTPVCTARRPPSPAGLPSASSLAGRVAAIPAGGVAVVALLVSLELAVAAHAAVRDARIVVGAGAAETRRRTVDTRRSRPRARCEPDDEQGDPHPSPDYGPSAWRASRPMVRDRCSTRRLTGLAIQGSTAPACSTSCARRSPS